ncbi:MAG TPA: F0F1 ATP synthase subunit B [Pirellulales bacterium]
MIRTGVAMLVAACLTTGLGSSAFAWQTDGAVVASTHETTAVVHGAAGDGHDAAGHAHEHLGAKGLKGHDPAAIREDLAVFSLVTFLLLLLVLWKYAWTPISQALDAREHRISDRITKADELEAVAAAKLAEYDRKLFVANDEIKAIIEEARRDGEDVKKAKVAEAEAEIATSKERALREIEMAKGQALKDLAEKSADLAVNLAGRVVKTQLSRADHDRLIADALSQLPSSN